MISKDIECFKCKYGENYPVFWFRHKAACLTIREERNEYEEQIAWDYKEHEYPYD